MATLDKKLSLKVAELFPDFVQADNAGIIDFLRHYYEFCESAELVLSNFGGVDKVLLEEGVDNYILMQNEEVRTEALRQESYILSEESAQSGYLAGEWVIGSVSKARALIRTEDINSGHFLDAPEYMERTARHACIYISTQNKFILGERVTGETSGATGNIKSYKVNPVETISELMAYADIDDSIDGFFDQFKSAFMRTIPKLLTSGVNKKNLLKNITDLYRAKGTRKGHELFFKILLNEDVSLFYPTENIIKASDGKWTYDTILRVSQGNDTLTLESFADAAMFMLLEDGSEVLIEDSIPGVHDSSSLIGQTISQNAIYDTSILEGGSYYSQGYLTIAAASAVVETVTKFTIGSETITELVLNKESLVGQFVQGQEITAVDNSNPDNVLYFKIVSVLTGTDIVSSGQYYDVEDPLLISSANGTDGAIKIESLTSGTVKEIVVDSGGTGFKIGDLVIVDNANTNGVGLSSRVTAVNGGVQVEVGSLSGWHLTQEDDSGIILMEEGSAVAIQNEEDYECLADDHIVYEDWTVYADTYAGNKIIQEDYKWDSGSAIVNDGDITDIQIVNTGLGYQKLPGLSFDSTLIASLPVAIDATQTSIALSTVDNFHPNRKVTGKIKINEEIIYYAGINVNTLTGCVRGFEATTAIAHQSNVEVYLYPSLGTGARLLAVGENIGKISQLELLNSGVHYHTDPLSGKVDATFLPITNFLVSTLTGNYVLDEVMTGSTSGATGIHVGTKVATNVVKLKSITGTFVVGETITGFTTGATSIIHSYGLTLITGSTGAAASSEGERLGLGSALTTFGKYVNQDGFISDSSMKVQDSYYYQDYSYVVETSSSIVTWREDVLNAVHPAGFAVFGQISRSTLLDARIRTVSTHPSVIPLRDTFTPDLLSVLQIVFTYKIGRRLGTTTQGILNSNPNLVIFGDESFSGDRDVTMHLGPGHMELVLPTYTGAIEVVGVTSWWKLVLRLLKAVPVTVHKHITLHLGEMEIEYTRPIHSLYEIDLSTGYALATSSPAIVSVATPEYEFILVPHVLEKIEVHSYRIITIKKRMARRLGTSDQTPANTTPMVVTGGHVTPDGVRDVLFRMLFSRFKETRKAFLDHYAGHGVMMENLPKYKDSILRGMPGFVTLEDDSGSIRNELATGNGNIIADAYEQFRGHIGYFEVRERNTLNEGGTMSATDTTITLTDASVFPPSGRIIIENEQIIYTGKSGNDLTGCTRGVYGSIAATHVDGSPVFVYRFIQGSFNASGYRIQDWASVTLNDVINNPESRGFISAPSEISIELTA